MLPQSRPAPILIVDMGAIRTNAAAAMLGVSPNTLRSWERRFGFPLPRRTAGGHRQFELAEIEALRSAFQETHNVSSAIALARERGEGPATPRRLKDAFDRFDEHDANRIVEESLSVRSVERTVEEVMLPGVDLLDASSAEHDFAWRWAGGWLAAQIRVAPPAHRPEGVLIFDASTAGDLDALHAQALELALRRGGLRVLTLTAATDPNRLTHALHALGPRVVILTGRRASLDTLGRIVFAARRNGGETVSVMDFRGALPETGAATIARLGDQPFAARERVLAHIENPTAVVAPLRAAV
jgi:DNA-binding transcriptional MerR regulator